MYFTLNFTLGMLDFPSPKLIIKETRGRDDSDEFNRSLIVAENDLQQNHGKRNLNSRLQTQTANFILFWQFGAAPEHNLLLFIYIKWKQEEK